MSTNQKNNASQGMNSTKNETGSKKNSAGANKAENSTQNRKNTSDCR